LAQQLINIGAYSVFLEETSSSNDSLKLLLNAESLPEGAVVYTHFQTKGRGMQGNGWESELAQNLLMSLYLKPQFLFADEQIWLNIMVSLALRDTAQELSSAKVSIKWPNDIFIEDKKVAGILIENVLQGQRIKLCITGIGLNLNQVAFTDLRAASLASFAGRPIDLNEARNILCQHLSRYYALLKAKQHTLLWDGYHEHLLGKGQMALFEEGGLQFEAQVMGIDKRGRLHLLVGDDIKSYAHKEVVFIKLLTN